MSEAENALLEDRANRNAARKVFEQRFNRVKCALEQRSIGGRMADTASARAAILAQDGLEVARESKGIIAATGAALAIWLLREPLRRLTAPVVRDGYRTACVWLRGLLHRKDI